MKVKPAGSTSSSRVLYMSTIAFIGASAAFAGLSSASASLEVATLVSAAFIPILLVVAHLAAPRGGFQPDVRRRLLALSLIGFVAVGIGILFQVT